uniref:Methylenetetrahydrofolate reductase (NAD(P)H) n=1 Tax=Corethron hystrix TaxID=216773 RepID=A0A7S1FMK7_9STRA
MFPAKSGFVKQYYDSTKSVDFLEPLNTSTLAHVKNERPLRIATISACSHNRESITQTALSFIGSDRISLGCGGGVDKILVVGGNNKKTKSYSNLSSVDAIKFVSEALRDCHSHSSLHDQVWAVSDPNVKSNSDLELVLRKMDAGASGIITQPFLLSRSFTNFEKYPDDMDYIVGVPFPRTSKSLEFWAGLLGPENLEIYNDDLFLRHMKHFESGKDSYNWVISYINHILNCFGDRVKGLHFMPISNTKDLISLFNTTTS